MLNLQQIDTVRDRFVCKTCHFSEVVLYFVAESVQPDVSAIFECEQLDEKIYTGSSKKDYIVNMAGTVEHSI